MTELFPYMVSTPEELRAFLSFIAVLFGSLGFFGLCLFILSKRERAQ